MRHSPGLPTGPRCRTHAGMAKVADKKQSKHNPNAVTARAPGAEHGVDSKPAKTDVALIHSPTEDGKGARILRYRDGELSAGEVRPAEEGKPLGEGELVKLNPVQDAPGLCNVEVLHDGSANHTAGKAPSTKPSNIQKRKQGHGPARVSNDAFRSNWNQVFAKPSVQKRKAHSVASKARATVTDKTGKGWSVN